MSQWGKTKYINGITYVPYINDRKVVDNSYIYDIYVSDSRGKSDEEVQEGLDSVKEKWIGQPYSEWIK